MPRQIGFHWWPADCGGVCEELLADRSGGEPAGIFDKGAGLAPDFSFADRGPKMDGDRVR